MAQLAIQHALDLALRHHQAGRLAEAEEIYRQVLAQQPDHPDAIYGLGMIALQVGHHDMAVDLIRRAISLKPDHAEAHFNLGNLLNDRGQHDEAIAAYRQAIALRPNYAEAHGNLGNVLRAKGRLDEAIAAFRQAIAFKPNFAEAHSNLGISLREKGQQAEAVACCRQAISLRPNYLEAHITLGNALKDKGQLDEAIAAYQQAIRINSDCAEAHYNLALAFKDKRQLDEAIAAYRQVIRLKPDGAVAHNNLALALLTRGYFREGWEEHEWRWKWTDFPTLPRNFPQPQWDGCPLEGRTLLLHLEQGFGDAIQFIRYLPLVAQRGGKIIVECHTELRRLFQTIAGTSQIVTRGQPLPAFDLHCPLLSLPRVFGTTLASIPQVVPYLSPDPALAEAWRQKLGAPGRELRVGLAWAGNPKFKGDRTRSLNLQQLSPLANARGVKFYSLQKGRAGEQTKNPPAGLEMLDLGPELNDFADTAAVMSQMDLIITTDTSVPHLAGALGRPVWVMLQFVPDWRWLLEREDSPWYPSMRLFRQPSRGDWDSVITRVVDALSLAKE